ncbi:MAG: hypothetical protein A4E63_03573 [Syntrophorhabdus sp. PtaU1.Bin050]|nr:MAG: hypothetical protein A4E63_03573 [Syntrophorhabdus sp. PtaU1.Bin050]
MTYFAASAREPSINALSPPLHRIKGIRANSIMYLYGIREEADYSDPSIARRLLVLTHPQESAAGKMNSHIRAAQASSISITSLHVLSLKNRLSSRKTLCTPLFGNRTGNVNFIHSRHNDRLYERHGG